MEIIHTVNTISKGSGVMELLMSYNRYLNDVNFNFIYMKDSKDNFSDEIEALGGSIMKYADFKQKSAFINRVNEIVVPDIIHNHIAVHSNWLSKTISKIYDVPMIVHAHSNRLSNSKFKEFRNKFLIINIRKQFDYFWGCSEESSSVWFGKDIVLKENTWIMPNAIDCSMVEQAITKYKNRQPESIKQGQPIVLGTIGRLSKEKNHLFLLKVLKKMLNTDSSIQLKIIGEGPNRNNLENEIENLNLSGNVTLMGNLSRAKLFEEITTFDLFVFPSLFEGFGTALVEAQAFNVYCLSSTNVPIETNMGCIQYLEDYVVDNWSFEAFRALSNRTVVQFNSEVKNKGYCIEVASKLLEEKYLGIVEYDKCKV